MKKLKEVPITDHEGETFCEILRITDMHVDLIGLKATEEDFHEYKLLDLFLRSENNFFRGNK